MVSTNNGPVTKFVAGGVSAALWRNTLKLRNGQEIETLSASLERRYKDQNGDWKSSGSFGSNDIPKAMLVLSKAYDYMVSKGSDDGQVVTEEEVVM
ncbi:MAG: hypothetical protein HOJ57_28600 [Lentisphaerae bacterium]|jgi:hypothetical protein|nr:hypothetical protein [Lentisphaerota bacterium]MBT5609933.1 hypothetical protein [Lentisphaerota bacterium]